jgi:hypothetical protein
MPEIKFNQSELDRHSMKRGVYASLRNTAGVVSLKVALVSIVESAFREYARKHTGCSPEMENREWQRFKKSLLKYL